MTDNPPSGKINLISRSSNGLSSSLFICSWVAVSGSRSCFRRRKNTRRRAQRVEETGPAFPGLNVAVGQRNVASLQPRYDFTGAWGCVQGRLRDET